ncbi:hypothetical protein BSKO_11163 [Bryopsis sp. KO-2023]|nr:hypothetical protein BSKO_11163 [Bryopsis sp. KO-2023]
MIEYIEFEEGARALAECCSRLDGSPSWEWLASSRKESLEDSGCLAVKHVIYLDKNLELPQEKEEECDQQEDEAGMKALPSGIDSHFYDFHVIYSHSYRVPVLWFRGQTPDGTPLGFTQILQDFPQLRSAVERMSGDSAAVSANEHPLLHTPWYFVHPCQTPSFMSLLLKEQRHPADSEGKGGGERKGLNFLVSWFSVVLPAFGLQPPNIDNAHNAT